MHHDYFEWAPCIETFGFFAKCELYQMCFSQNIEKIRSITVSFNITFSGKSTTSIRVCSLYSSTIHSWGRVETLFYGYVCIECDARKIISQSSCEMRRMLLYRSIVLLTSKPSSSLLQPLLISFKVLLLFYQFLCFLFCN